MDKDSRLIAVQSPDDIDFWLKQMPELKILADVEPVFISGEDDFLSVNTWQKMAEAIQEKSGQADGFVVVARTEQLLNTALATGFLLQNFDKSLVFTSAQISGTDFLVKKEVINKLKSKQGGLGLRSNLINAIQAADRVLPGPAIMFGTRLIAATRALPVSNDDKNIFASVDNSYWGKVDFGISIKSGLARPSRALKIYKNLAENILLLEDAPEINWSLRPEVLKNYQAIIVKLSGNYYLDKTKENILVSSHCPVVLYHSDLTGESKAGLVIGSCTWPVAVVKTMWAAANYPEPDDFKRVMQQNIMGEFINSSL